MNEFEKNMNEDQEMEIRVLQAMQKMQKISNGYAKMLRDVAASIEGYADLIKDSQSLVFPGYDSDHGYENDSETGKDFEVEEDELGDDDEFYEDDAIVLYAEPGKAVRLVEEECAINEMIVSSHVSGFKMHFITDELMAIYPKDCETEHSDGSVFVAGPLYICHPIIDEFGDDDPKMDLTAVDFCDAMAYLSTHTVKEKTSGRIGFLLGKED